MTENIFDGLETKCTICKKVIILGKNDNTVLISHHKVAHKECWDNLKMKIPNKELDER